MYAVGYGQEMSYEERISWKIHGTVGILVMVPYNVWFYLLRKHTPGTLLLVTLSIINWELQALHKGSRHFQWISTVVPCILILSKFFLPT